jgi:hypothetical protein
MRHSLFHQSIALLISVLLMTCATVDAQDTVVNNQTVNEQTRFSAAKTVLQKLLRDGEEVASPDAATVKLAVLWQTASKRLAESSKDQSEALEQFLSAVKEETSTTPPDWWATAVSKTSIREGNLSVDVSQWKKKQSVCDSVRFVEPIVVECEAKSIQLGDVKVDIDQLPLLNLRALSRVSGESVDGHAIVAAASDFPFSYPLRCYNARKMRWETTVWGLGQVTVFGRGSHVVEVAPGKSTVTIFGAATNGFYVEAFSVESGKRIAAMSSKMLELP